MNDDDDDTPSVFSDISSVIETTENGYMTSPGSENGYYDDEIQLRQRRRSGHRDNRAQSPTVSLRNFAPSPSPRTQRTNEVKKKTTTLALCFLLCVNKGMPCVFTLV